MKFWSRGFATAAWLLLLMSCGGGGASTSSPPPSASISASQSSVSSGAASNLTWSSSNTTSCTASGGWSGVKSLSGSQSTGALTATTTYSLTCTGADGTNAVVSVTIDVLPVATLSATPLSVASGASAQLSWTSSSATSCAATGGWSGVKSSSGSQSTGALTAATTYSLTCTGAGGTRATASVTVNVAPLAALAASPQIVSAGGSSQLSWSSTNATSCTAHGGWSGAKSTAGSQGTGPLSAGTTFSLACSGPGGVSSLVSVSVNVGQVTVSPAIAAITPAQSPQFSATVSGGGAVTWTVDGIAGGNGTVGTIGTTGLFTPGTAPGRHMLVATSVAYASLSGSAVAAVTDLAGVYTYRNDSARDGANTKEYALTPGSVGAAGFGKLFSCTVDGAIYAQPLWAADLTVNGTPRNVIFVATQHDSLYAFDADASPCVQLWSASLIDAAHGGSIGETTVPSGVPGYLVGLGEGDITPEVGVTGTPVLDPVSGTLYVVSKSVNAGESAFYQRLHAIDLASGSEKTGSPVTISGTYPGTGDGGAVVTFNPQTQNQRPGLALINGIVYVAWAAHEDAPPWYGWVMGYSYNGTSFSQPAVFNAAPNGSGGGIWMGGGAPASDSIGDLYVVTGNGTFDAASGSAPNNDYGESLLQLTSTLNVAQYFTPSDEVTDNGGDLDFGAGGAAVLADLPSGSPVPHLLVCGGKDGALYLLNRDALGGFGDHFAAQKISYGYRILATGAYWNSSFYLAGAKGPLTAYALNASVPALSLDASSSHAYGFPGSSPSVSASGTSEGIVWTLDTSQYCTSNAPGCGPAVLYAHDAANVATQLWSSGGLAADAAGNAVKFAVPTVANGKVYVGTRGNNTGGVYGSTSIAGELDVYGLQSN
ncbi:MAG: hypothetical protein ACLP2F_08600 [Steroidobacteraceae bacterium]